MIADLQYERVIRNILYNGKWDKDQSVRTVWEDGEKAYTLSVLNERMIFNNAKNALLLTTKRVPTKDPIQEMFWIWKFKSNNVKFLRENLGCNVWNEWEREDGTIGKAYGWQLANKFRRVKANRILLRMHRNGNGELSRNFKYKDGYVYLDQVDYLIYTLKTNPSSRRIKTTLWCVEDLDDMALEPCVYETHWQLWDGKLHLTVNIRSNDMGLGNPYNIYQYSILHRLIAQVTGHDVGTICFNIDNAHIYDRHIEALKGQVNRPIHASPEVWINPEIKSFYDFTIDDIEVKHYQYDERPVKLEVAV